MCTIIDYLFIILFMSRNDIDRTGLYSKCSGMSSCFYLANMLPLLVTISVHWTHRFAKVNVNKVKKIYGIDRINSSCKLFLSMCTLIILTMRFSAQRNSWPKRNNWSEELAYKHPNQVEGNHVTLNLYIDIYIYIYIHVYIYIYLYI